ncbi:MULTISPECIES: 23S rRNA (pseudouridine(1915)-N(3))-methyltransferase RlmH [Peptoniphilus]|uniref:23S rRNA (pseudouridine(1915)-N(3))-methyltransferase RlmH n=1 Tax=Peptoniphilus TaxID=162289 RepID=UPI0001DA9FCA|nr:MULTISPECIES: 23S rRNA (pseudouridine(1915)-N(3))-methyltransferase RlmH [Peptoniphilus]EFI41582.1 rRNA large subunit m3Psi methyltransferase RlmH [Peptoniphilus sp. oral taxon 386 str. F0131]
MNINIIAVGRVREKYIRDGIDEFKKRLSAHAVVKIVEVSDESAPEKLSDNEIKQIKEKEAERILKNIRETDYVITLEIKGEKVSSEKFADKLQKIQLSGNSTIDFIIGGSLGLAENISKRANYKLSFSDMTFPHQLMRLILLEQIYRAFRIANGFPYHK